MSDYKNQKGDFLRTEYSALSNYHNRVITFRFTTVAFFIAAVAFILRIDKLDFEHYLLLLLISLGIWIIELRNRAIFDNLLRRGRKIEEYWGSINRGDLPFYSHMTPIEIYKDRKIVPDNVQFFDKTRIAGFHRFSARYISHTLGLDIVYLSVIGYSIWGLCNEPNLSIQGGNMELIKILSTLIVFLSGIFLIKTVVVEREVRLAKWALGIGIVLSSLALVALTILIF